MHRAFRFLLTSLLLIALLARSAPSVQAKAPPDCANPSSRMVTTTVPSALYHKPVAVTVYLPPCYAAEGLTRYPVFYLLHGGGAADETQWPDLNVQFAADALLSQDNRHTPPFVVVMPGATYYENIDYGAFVVSELLPSIEAQYNVSTTRAGRAVGGLSLGGFWALKLMFAHPDLFFSIGAYSPVVNRGQAGDPLPLARQADATQLQTLRLDLDVGDQDSLRYDTQQIAQVLRDKGVTLTLTIGHGGHVRPYWRAHSYAYLGFFLDQIKS